MEFSGAEGNSKDLWVEGLFDVFIILQEGERLKTAEPAELERLTGMALVSRGGEEALGWYF